MAIDSSSSSLEVEGFKSSQIFEQIQKTLQEKGQEVTGKVGAVYLFKVLNAQNKEASWIVDAKSKSGSVKVASEGDKAEVTITIKDDDLVDLLSGKLSAAQGYFQGRLRVQGNMGLAMKLQSLLQSHVNDTTQLKSKL